MLLLVSSIKWFEPINNCFCDQENRLKRFNPLNTLLNRNLSTKSWTWSICLVLSLKLRRVSFVLKAGLTMDLRWPFMVLRLNSDENWKAYMTVSEGLFRSVTVQGTQSYDLYHFYMDEMTSRALLWSSILADFWVFIKSR